MSKHVTLKRKDRTRYEYGLLLKVHILPVLGSRRIVDIKRHDVGRLHSSLSDRPFRANRCLALISSIWTWASRRDEVQFGDNPAKGIERNPEHGRERYLTADEFARLGDVLRIAETIGLPWSVDETKSKAKNAPKPDKRRTIADPFAVAAIRLLVLTGARLREILHAKWETVDFERGILHLADSKTGRKPIYLSSAVLDILSELPRIEGNPYVIPGDNEGAARADLKRPWAAIVKAAKLEGTRLHDLRHSFASIGAAASMGLPIIGRLLGQRQPQITARYAHLHADPLRKAADTIGATISAAMESGRTAVLPNKKPLKPSIILDSARIFRWRRFFQPVELPEKCFLQEVLYWVAFQRLPIADRNSDGNELRETADIVEEYDIQMPNRFLQDDECARANIPSDPRLAASINYRPMINAETFDRLMLSGREYDDETRKRIESQRQEVKVSDRIRRI